MDKATSRLRVLALLVVVMFLALSTRLWFLQVLAAQGFNKEAHAQSVRTVYADPLRGQILDASSTPTHPVVLVGNRESLEVRITPSELGSQGEAVILRVSQMTGVPVSEIAKTLQDPKYLPTQAIPVAEFVPKNVKYAIAEHPQQFPGVSVESTFVRSYPMGTTAAQVLGYTGLIDSTQYAAWQKNGYGPNDIVGKNGVELSYEQYLRGEQGVTKLLVNSDGEALGTVSSTKPTPGDDVQLSLNDHVEKLAQKALLDGMQHARSYHDQNGNLLRANAGAVVVMDAHTGGIVAMVSTPSYNPLWYERGLTPSQSKYLSNSNIGAINNRATQLAYTPGSTFKPITGLAAIKEGYASLGGSYNCVGTYTQPGDTSGAQFVNWTTANLGYMSIQTALSESCDTVFDAFGSDFYYAWANNPLGTNSDPLQGDLKQWGFEQPTGVDLPYEVSGLVPDPAWANTQKTLFPYGWVPGGDILTMIGSGYVQVTPLQLARAYAAIANGGHLCTPHVVNQIISSSGTVVKKIGGDCAQTVPYSASELSYIRGALRSVVTSGTAQCAFQGFPFSQVAVAGKTGTAERPNKQDTSWFASMVGPNPERPDYVIVTMVEQGGFGGQTAAPITRQVIDGLYPKIGDASSPSCVTPDR
ncbi:MAG TPA: penicillin-binding protein 2 [Actinomycetota bacterium]|nr:penicillin-binding protein 2 [Actinomycetota bacterium]